MDGSGESGVRRFLWLALGIGLGLFLISLFISLAFDGEAVDVGLAIGTGIGGAAVWWAAFARYAESAGERILNRRLSQQGRQLQNELDEHRALLAGELEENARRWRDSSLPRAIYPPTNGFDLRFNRDSTKHLARSSKYFFCGPSGVFVPARIILRETEMNPPLEEVRLRIVNPLRDIAMERTIEQRRGKPKSAAEDAGIRQQVNDDLFMMIVGLWHARDRVGKVQVWYESAAVIKRLELFEDAVYDAPDIRGPEEFPMVVRWDSLQPTYTQRLAEFDHNESEATLTFTPRTPESVLIEHLAFFGFDPGERGSMLERFEREYVNYFRGPLQKALELRETVPIREAEQV